MANEEPDFLTLDEVLAVHSHQIDVYGGSHGVRDMGALQSALAMPASTFDGVYLHETVFDQAAAYLFHLSRYHPFVDGNKRIGLAAALSFLRFNGWRLRATEDDVVDVVLSVATGAFGKSELSVWLKERCLKAGA